MPSPIKHQGLGASLENAFDVSAVMSDTDGNDFRITRLPDQKLMISSVAAINGSWVNVTCPPPAGGVNPESVKEIWKNVKSIFKSVLGVDVPGGPSDGGGTKIEVHGDKNVVVIIN